MNKFILIFIALFAVSCTQISTKEQKNVDVLPLGWIVLDAENSQAQNSWNFEAKYPGKYVVQILYTNERVKPSVKIAYTFKQQETKEVVKNTRTNYTGQKFIDFKRPVEIKEAGTYTLSVSADVSFSQVRLVPNHQTKIGYAGHEAEWRKMHTSPPKQNALAWFKQAKFGMFIHWGLYAKAGGVWKGVRIEDSPHLGPHVAEWLMSTFQISRAEYGELAKTFNPDKTFAQNITKLAKAAGMKYVVITAKHHDGFALFDSKCSDFDIVDATPYEGDAIKELYEACLAEGLDFGVYYSHGNDWRNGSDGNYTKVKKINDSLGIPTHRNGKNFWDPSNNTFEEYLDNKSYTQIRELINLLPKLKLIWFDGDGNVTDEQSFQFYKMVYDLNPNILVNRRVGYQFGDYNDAGDNKIPSATDKQAKYWETCGTTNNSWGYKSYDDDWKNTQELLYYFVDIMSKGGNYLLNIGPDGQGHVPDTSAKRLREMGTWINTNQQAIYGSSRWKITSEGTDETDKLSGTGEREKRGFKRTFSPKEFWFTTKNNIVYAISVSPPTEKIIIKSLSKNQGEIKEVEILGLDDTLSWEQTKDALYIEMPKNKNLENGYAVAVSFKNKE